MNVHLGKAHVVVVERVGHNQVRASVVVVPIRQVIGVAVWVAQKKKKKKGVQRHGGCRVRVLTRVVEKTALLHDQSPGVGVGLALINSHWALSDKLLVNLDDRRNSIRREQVQERHIVNLNGFANVLALYVGLHMLVINPPVPVQEML